ncbi:hypothetical protein [uncultured Aquimarina sp.]|uniref:hypothetical protein n=1 Tax=uncultured Aquimarina sp. TaxID=575652 RepID=UPI0026099803|nr:hypothetical protein [uncultured Aquimarina sp.]
MKTKLKEIIDQLYTVFGKYSIEVAKLRDYSCPCCVTDNEIKVITKKPIKELSAEDLGHFIRSAISTFGSIEDYKHFLPRILELMTLESSSDIIDDFTCFEKLNYAEWETWPENEIQIIENFFTELWNTIINGKNSTEFMIGECFSLIKMYGPIEPALKKWKESKTEISSLYIVNGILNGFAFRAESKNEKIISKWLYSKPVLDKIEKVYFNQEDKETANRIAIAHTILENKYPITFAF